MASQVLDDLVVEVRESVEIQESATILINGFGQRLTDAIAKAMKNGATESELAPLTDLKNEVNAKKTALAEAVLANTPSEE